MGIIGAWFAAGMWIYSRRRCRCDICGADTMGRATAVTVAAKP